MNKVYYISTEKSNRNTAGKKAPDDISEICRRNGYECIEAPLFPSKKNVVLQKLWLLFVCTAWWMKLGKLVKANDIVIYQHPSYGTRVAIKMINRIKQKKECKFVVIIHDLESLRQGIDGVIKDNKKTNNLGDNNLLKLFDAVICHNKKMKEYLVSQGFERDKIITLDIFDYLSFFQPKEKQKSKKPTIAIAGNLAYGKCKYIYNISNFNSSLSVNLYGSNFDQERANDNLNFKYKGSFNPDVIPSELNGDFGLVWDGDSLDTCSGNTGNYLRFNNPHKTSLYLSAGMPVIVWKDAAIADFVLNNEVGIVVDNLRELDKVIMEISDDQYRNLQKNACAISEKLRAGYYTISALNRAFGKIEL